MRKGSPGGTAVRHGADTGPAVGKGGQSEPHRDGPGERAVPCADRRGILDGVTLSSLPEVAVMTLHHDPPPDVTRYTTPSPPQPAPPEPGALSGPACPPQSETVYPGKDQADAASATL